MIQSRGLYYGHYVRQIADKFIFDFEHDGANDIVSLTKGSYQVEAFGKCFYYGYEFAGTVNGSVRTSFIKHVKFSESIQNDNNLCQFIQKAINELDEHINLYDYDLVMMPESSSKVNQYMLRYIYRFAQPRLYKMEFVKSLPDTVGGVDEWGFLAGAVVHEEVYA